jgi:phenylacetate-coenzyme A ligase PaaK-like adenylate-forming protein
MEAKHLWQGNRIDDTQLKQNLENIKNFTNPILGKPFPLEYFFTIAQKMQNELLKKETLYESFVKKAMQTHQINREKAESLLLSIVSFICASNMKKKLSSELGTSNPFNLERTSMKEEHFESWMPLGTLVHIAPTNVFTVGVLCVIEGLLSGNINILKTSINQNQLPQLFFEALLKYDTLGLLKPYIIILEVSSKENELLQQIINCADVVSAWGSEEAISSIRSMTPQGVRFVAWGHKISFAYFAKECLKDTKAIEKVCEDICLLDQNACSSPQDVFIQSNDFEELKEFAQNFAKILEKVSSKMPRTTPCTAEQAEISTVISIAKVEEALGLTHVIQDKNFTWSIIADTRSSLGVSPLYRTLLIKPLLAEDIIATLHPMKSYLQTAALIAPKEKIVELSQKLFGAGCLRIREAGHMHEGYVGEPHDGVFALPSFMKRTSLLLGNQLDNIATFQQFNDSYEENLKDTPIMIKQEFQAMQVAQEYVDLTFKSGGSSGKTTYSYFTYEDYHAQMKATAHGLFAAGLNPKKDKVINMFAAGHLYGGFLSFFSILEELRVPQYPMGVVEDLEEVGKLIVEKNINAILSLPALIMKLFKANEILFKKHKTLKKLFFGGDHFASEQIEYLKKEFGVELVKAAAYGSNDAGPLGYQCPHCQANEYHLLSNIQSLEVFSLDEEKLLKDTQVGRLVFSSKERNGQKILRYDVGDTGYINQEPCPCGRKDKKFTLLGRSSDAFKAGGPFLHFEKFTQYLQDLIKYKDVAQIILENEGVRQKITLRVTKNIEVSKTELEKLLIKNYEELMISVQELGVKFEVAILDIDKFDIVAHSSKIRHIVDRRI